MQLEFWEYSETSSTKKAMGNGLLLEITLQVIFLGAGGEGGRGLEDKF